MALWRGPALPDLDGDAVTGLRARLERRLVTAQAEHADAQVALGHAEHAVAELESLVQQHPLDEGLVVRLMTALYHSGRQADALAAYGAGGRAAGRRARGRPGRPAARRPGSRAAAVPRSRRPARRSAGPLIAGGAELAAARRPAAQRPARRAGRPSRPASGCAARAAELIGRRAEIQQALDLLADPAVRVVTILGPGGIGKTRLALALADELTKPPAELEVSGGLRRAPSPPGPRSSRWPRSPTRASCWPRSCRRSAPRPSGRARTWSSC